MTYESYRYIFIGGLVLSALMLILSVVLFFTMNIRKLIGEYNGTTKRKAIEKIRKKSSGEIAFTGQTAAPKAPVVEKPRTDGLKGSSETAKIKPQDRYDSMEASETTTLSEYTAHNTVNESQHSVGYETYNNTYYDDFIVETDITFVHSNEVIR